MSSRLDLAFRDRETYEAIKTKLHAILDDTLADIARMNAMAPVEPDEYDRVANPAAFNKAVASYAYAKKGQREAIASLTRAIEPLMDLLIDPDAVQAERERERSDLIERQEQRLTGTLRFQAMNWRPRWIPSHL